MEALSVSSANAGIDKVLAEESKEINNELGLGVLGRVVSSDEWHSVFQKIMMMDAHNGNNSNANINTNFLDTVVPYYFGIGCYHRRQDSTILLGFVSFYMAYSTWDGRTLFIDQMKLPAEGNDDNDNNNDETNEKSMLQVLSRIALRLGCTRMTWKHTRTPAWYLNDPNPPEILREWLQLGMDQKAMEKYVSEASGVNFTSSSMMMVTNNNNDDDEIIIINRKTVEQAAQVVLEKMAEKAAASGFHLRAAAAGEEEDMDTISRLVQGLAIFEKEPDAVNVTAKDYLRDGEGGSSDQPLFYCLLIEDISKGEPYTCGMAFFYLGFDFKGGRFLYLEDLFIEEPYRKRGGGTVAMQSLACLSLALQCSQFCWTALDWNTPALNLYKKIGAKVQEGVLLTRYSGNSLRLRASP